MRIIVDTNVLISALVFDGRVLRLLEFLCESCYEVLVSEYIDSELRYNLFKKWPDRVEKIYAYCRAMNFIFCPSSPKLTGTLRDPKDIPVLSDALYNNADITLTGDKDFLESEIAHPLIYSAT